jgi:hypothetical protein
VAIETANRTKPIIQCRRTLHTFWMSVKLIIDFEYFTGWACFETGGRSSTGRRLKMSDVVEDDDGGVIEVGEDLGAWTAAS